MEAASNILILDRISIDANPVCSRHKIGKGGNESESQGVLESTRESGRSDSSLEWRNLCSALHLELLSEASNTQDGCAAFVQNSGELVPGTTSNWLSEVRHKVGKTRKVLRAGK
eukprot:scaffold150060_cov19-Tisochrysis_lutea.AAC.2